MNKKGLFKLLTSLIMLGIVLYFVDFAKLKSTLLHIPLKTLALVIFGYVLGQVLSSYKWWTIARSGGRIRVPWNVALKAYFLGMYVNCFTGFGTVGGDVTRGMLLGHSEALKTEGVFSVIADRMHGLLVLICTAIIAVATVHHADLDALMVYGLYAAALILVMGWFVGPALLLAMVPRDHKLRLKVEGIASVFPKSPLTIIYVSVISLLFHTVQLSLHWVMGMGVGVNLSAATILTAVPFVNILSSLPISWQGLGVRESGYLFFLAAVLSTEQALAFGAMWLLAMIVASALGGIIAVVSGDLKLVSGRVAG